VRRLILFLCLSCVLAGCGVYSFSGASISPDVKTIHISVFPNRASLVQPVLSQTFTDKLKEKFISQTSLTQVTADADLRLEGYISDYRANPVAIQGTQTAALNRLTITIQVKFTNEKDPKMNFDAAFSRYSDYDSRKNLTEVELGLIDEINRQLVDDIFNRAVSNW
jgi:hypothetical protein